MLHRNWPLDTFFLIFLSLVLLDDAPNGLRRLGALVALDLHRAEVARAAHIILLTTRFACRRLRARRGLRGRRTGRECCVGVFSRDGRSRAINAHRSRALRDGLGQRRVPLVLAARLELERALVLLLISRILRQRVEPVAAADAELAPELARNAREKDELSEVVFSHRACDTAIDTRRL
jgi:hypothetical protein